MRMRLCSLPTRRLRVFREALRAGGLSRQGAAWVLAAAAMGKTVDSLGQGTRPDPVRSFNRWKKKHSHRQHQKKERRKQLKKPEWQVEREGISRLMQNYEKVRRALGGEAGAAGRCRRCAGHRGRVVRERGWTRLGRPHECSFGCRSPGLALLLATVLDK